MLPKMRLKLSSSRWRLCATHIRDQPNLLAVWLHRVAVTRRTGINHLRGRRAAIRRSPNIADHQDPFRHVSVMKSAALLDAGAINFPTSSAFRLCYCALEGKSTPRPQQYARLPGGNSRVDRGG